MTSCENHNRDSSCGIHKATVLRDDISENRVTQLNSADLHFVSSPDRKRKSLTCMFFLCLLSSDGSQDQSQDIIPVGKNLRAKSFFPPGYKASKKSELRGPRGQVSKESRNLFAVFVFKVISLCGKRCMIYL